jgi:hypothetical protein
MEIKPGSNAYCFRTVRMFHLKRPLPGHGPQPVTAAAPATPPLPSRDLSQSPSGPVRYLLPSAPPQLPPGAQGSPVCWREAPPAHRPARRKTRADPPVRCGRAEGRGSWPSPARWTMQVVSRASWGRTGRPVRSGSAVLDDPAPVEKPQHLGDGPVILPSREAGREPLQRIRRLTDPLHDPFGDLHWPARRVVVDLKAAFGPETAPPVLYPAAVPAAGVFVRVILEQPGEPRSYALSILLRRTGAFRARFVGRLGVRGCPRTGRSLRDRLRRLTVLQLTALAVGASGSR